MSNPLAHYGQCPIYALEEGGDQLPWFATREAAEAAIPTLAYGPHLAMVRAVRLGQRAGDQWTLCIRGLYHGGQVRIIWLGKVPQTYYVTRKEVGQG